MLAQRQRLGFLPGVWGKLHGESVSILLRHCAPLVDRSRSKRWNRLGADAVYEQASGGSDRCGSWRGRGEQNPPEMRQQIGADRASEPGGDDLDELHEEA